MSTGLGCFTSTYSLKDESQGWKLWCRFSLGGDAFCAKPQSVLIESCPNSESLILDLEVINNVLKDLHCALNCQRQQDKKTTLSLKF